MSDNKNFDEEYQYVEEPELEPIEVDPETVSEKTETAEKPSEDYVEKISSLIQQPSMKRNALLAVIGLFFLLGLLKCVSKPSPSEDMSAPKPIIQNTAPAPAQSQMMQTMTDNQMQDLMNMQKSMQANLASMNDKMNQLNSQLSVLNSNNQVLQQQLSDLMSKYQALQQSINEAIAAAKSKPQITHHQASRPRVYSAPVIKESYFVQAIIPGRAWLVSSQGKTITVRVGSLLPGYGRVAKIDAQQGRVEMSSSKVFVFSQAD